MKIERIDRAESFQTIFRISKDNEAQELLVNVWDADEVEAQLIALSWEEITALRELDNTNNNQNRNGVTIKEE